MSAQHWLRRYERVRDPVARVVCFPHAGGGARFFRSWCAGLPPGVELCAVQYPGREDRIREPCATDLSQIADAVAAELLARHRVPTVLFGHSLGAAAAYETALRLRRAGETPGALAVSGRAAPHDPGRMLHRTSDDELWDDVCRSGGTSEEVLRSAEMRELMLPVLRADYRLSERYLPGAARPLDCPVLACNGDRDPEVDPDSLPGWQAVAARPLRYRTFPGGHFYLVDQRPGVVAAVLDLVSATTPAAVRWPSMP